MDDTAIFCGVQEADEKLLFKNKVEQDIEDIQSEKERLAGEIQKYDRLIQTLDLLPRELSWNLPHVALTKHALLPNAALVNTNEVTVHIGDNWFTRCSAHHAKGICARRQNKCKDTIAALNEREKMLLSWQKASKGAIVGGRDDFVVEDEASALFGALAGEDIQEFVTEEQYLADKEIHKEKVKEHYQKERGKREQVQKDEQVSDTELWDRLVALQMEEQSSGELRSMERSARSAAPEREIAAKKKKGGVKFADEVVSEPTSSKKTETVVKLGWSWDDENSSSSSEDSCNSETHDKTEEKSVAPPRKLTFAQHIETGSDDTSVIEFCHTPEEFVASASSKVKSDEVKSPSDIYSSFHEVFAAAAATPKSILKQPIKEVDDSEQWPTISYPFSYIEGDLPSSDSEYDNDEEEMVTTERKEVLCDVFEKDPVTMVQIKPPEVKESAISEAIALEIVVAETPVPSVPKKSVTVKFCETAEHSQTNSKHGNKKMSKFKSSRMANKTK